ncbi:MAG: hypothetical protein ABSA01_12445 [Anaerolineales bacterium]
MLAKDAEPITKPVIRNDPRNGNLLVGRGCFTERMVASIVARRLELFFFWARLRRRRWEE